MVEKCADTASYLRKRAGNEILVKFEHGKLGGVEHFVTELSVSFHAKDLKVDVTTYRIDSEDTALVHIAVNVPPEEYAQSANLSASLPHSGMPLGKSFFWPALALRISFSSRLPS